MTASSNGALSLARNQINPDNCPLNIIDRYEYEYSTKTYAILIFASKCTETISVYASHFLVFLT